MLPGLTDGMPSFPRLLSALVLVPLAFAGCDDEDDGGSAPVVDSLTLSGEDARVGMLSTVTGTLGFSDPDGDVEEARIELSDPAGTTTTVMTEIVGVSGMTEGTVVLQLAVLAMETGEHEATLTLIDAEGNESDPETATFEVTQ